MCCPSLNIVNMFDKNGADGIYYPIDDQRSGYALDYAHKPFEDRDPRFYNNILLPGTTWGHYADGRSCD